MSVDIPFPGFGPAAARIEVSKDSPGSYQVRSNARYGSDLYRGADELVFEGLDYDEAISTVCAILDSLLTLE